MSTAPSSGLLPPARRLAGHSHAERPPAKRRAGGTPQPVSGVLSVYEPEHTDWCHLPALVLNMIATTVGRTSFTVLAMHHTCRSWHYGLGRIYRPATWASRCAIFGARAPYIAWALEARWLDPAGALTLAAGLGDVAFMRALEQCVGHAMRAADICGRTTTAILHRATHDVPPDQTATIGVHTRHTHTASIARVRTEGPPTHIVVAIPVHQRDRMALAHQRFRQLVNRIGEFRRVPGGGVLALAGEYAAIAIAIRPQPPPPRAEAVPARTPRTAPPDRLWAPLRSRLEEALHTACDKGHYAALVFLHQHLGLTTEQARSRNNFALRAAAHNLCTPIIRYLFDNLKLAIEDLRCHDNYAMRVVCEQGHLLLATLFLDHGLTSDDVRACDNEVLCTVCINGRVAIVELLLCGRRLLTVDDVRSRNYYPLRAACWNGHLDIVRLLVEMGLAAEELARGDYLVTVAAMLQHSHILHYLVMEKGVAVPPWLEEYVLFRLATMAPHVTNVTQ
jgi:hypothetical protein